jgi:high-affinity iron transporter
LTRGAAVYRANCALCHGELGDAATERAKQLTPPPLSFLGDKARESLSPYQTFNVSTFGVAGTSMASFDLVPARERWDAAFYVAALRHPKPPAAAPAGIPSIALHELAVLTDAELDARLAALGRSETQRPLDLAWLRAHPPGAIAGLTAAGDGGRLVRARADLERTCTLYREGKPDEAVRVSLDSYLRDIEPVEVSLRAGDRALAGRIEAGYVALRGEMRAGAPSAAIARAAEAIDRDLTYADVKLAGGRSAAVSALASLFIILREGVEAVLLVAAMLGLVRKLGRPDAAKSIHAAWLAALAAGGLTWAAARWLVSVSAAQRELVEGVVGLLAAGILAYTSYWILSRADAKHWLDFLRTQLSGALERRGRAAMFGVAFLAVYREAFETVLFYEALLTESDGGGTAPVVLGFAAGVLLLTVVAFGILRLSKKLPIRAFFTVSGALLYGLAFVFAGAGIHALVEGGYLDPRPIRFPTIEWLGVYPDLLGVGLQAAFVAAVALGLYIELKGRRRAVAAT